MSERITLTHLNIRQSIVILLGKLVVIDIIAAVIIISFYFLLIQGGAFTSSAIESTTIFLIAFGAVGIFKIIFGIYIVLLWLNEYYEITPENIVHKKGIFFRKSERYELEKVRMIDVQDSLLGELFNFATITLYDIRLQKYTDMYLIHNPKRYVKVLKTLNPHIELKEDSVRLPFKKKQTDDIEDM